MLHLFEIANGRLKNLPSFEVSNLGTGKGTTLLELLNSYALALGKVIPTKFQNKRPGDAPKFCAENSKSTDVLGFQCARSINEMCLGTVRWQKFNPNEHS